mgnify:CR=1 FL=1
MCAPKANSICERFLGSVRRECLDHFLILRERHLQRIVTDYVAYFNQMRPHQGIGQQIPDFMGQAVSVESPGQPIVRVPVLGGLHHAYSRAA